MFNEIVTAIQFVSDEIDHAKLKCQAFFYLRMNFHSAISRLFCF